LHPARLAGLDGDYDGDKVNTHALMSNEANEENTRYTDSIQSVLKPNGEFTLKLDTIASITMFAVTQPPKRAA
jgi:hypothetical protein